MNKVLKLTLHDDMKVFFTSDFHLNHSPKWPIPIWKSRGFDSVSEMNESIIKSINDCVKPTDILFFLGDFVLNCSEPQFEEFLSRINCQTIYMIFGNHNSCVWNVYQREIQNFLEKNNVNKSTLFSIDIEVYPFRYRNLVFLGNYAEVSVDGIYFILTHYPIHSWNYMKQGSIHLYGHQHSKNNPQGGKRLDVGWAGNKRPYSINDILDKMKDIPILSDGGHH